MPSPFGKGDKATFLAPMQDITDLGFLNTVCQCGAPDFCIAEYIRIHEYYELDPHVLDTVMNSSLGDRVAVQFIGEDQYYILKAIEELAKYPQIKMLDLNAGCPAPKIYRKNVGGGLLRDPKKLSAIIKDMRAAWGNCLSVKMRLGFDSCDNFDELLDAVLSGAPDFVTIHARTVKQLYRGDCDYSFIASAVEKSPVPIVANGDIGNYKKAVHLFETLKCAGVMCGRQAVRNPWIFRQIKESLAGKTVFCPTLADVRGYVEKLYANIINGNPRIRFADSCMKKLLNFIGTGVDEKGEFLYNMRRANGIDELFKVCDKYMVENSNAEKLFGFDAYPNLCARPNHEDRPL